MYIEIKTERLLLRPLCMDDLDTVHQYASDADLTRYMMYLPNDTLEESCQFIADAVNQWGKSTPEFFVFAVMLGGLHIGAVCLYLSDDRKKGELGWILNKHYHGNGYAVEAADAVIGYARQLGLGAVYAHCDSRNKASEKVMQRLGMELVSSDGTRYYKKSGETAEELCYKLVF